VKKRVLRIWLGWRSLLFGPKLRNLVIVAQTTAEMCIGEESRRMTFLCILKL
jgi:hypothetical protein